MYRLPDRQTTVCSIKARQTFLTYLVGLRISTSFGKCFLVDSTGNMGLAYYKNSNTTLKRGQQTTPARTTTTGR